MLNFAIEPAVLAPLVPAGTELDAWNGITYASVVGFRFRDTRVLGVPIPFHRDFEEVNLRFYVRRREGGEVRRGVVFVRELVPRRAIAIVARAAYNEPYLSLPMRHAIERPASDPPGHIEYAWRRTRWERISARTPAASEAVAEGSEEEFITEHYWGYTTQRDGGTLEYRVEHPRWRVWRADAAELDADAASLYGPSFVPALSGPPRSAFVADGSAVTVYRPRRLPRR